MADKSDEIFTIQEAAHYLRIPLSSLYKLVKSGNIPAQKVGRHWRFRRGAIDRWLDENPFRANSPPFSPKD
jgi:excisionase family DNA binding protein